METQCYFAVDKDGTELVFQYEPILNDFGRWTPKRRHDDRGFSYENRNFVELPTGTIERLIGIKITHENSPVKVNDYNGRYSIEKQ